MDRFAFRYELVRRIAKLLHDPETRKLVKPHELRRLQKARPFKDLGFPEQQILLYQFYRDSGERPVTTTSRYLREQLEGYSERFPAIHFDLRASDHAVAQAVLSWIREQQHKAGLGAAKNLGPKGRPSRNRVQNHQPASWHHLAWLDAPKDHKLKARGHATKLRQRLLEQALRNLPTVLAGLKRITEDARKFDRFYCAFPEQ
jgi:hypothetical protein